MGTPLYTGHQDIFELDKKNFFIIIKNVFTGFVQKLIIRKGGKIFMFGCPHIRYGIYI